MCVTFNKRRHAEIADQDVAVRFRFPLEEKHTIQFAAPEKALTVRYNRQHYETAFAPGLRSQSVSCVTPDRYMHHDRERSRVLTCDDGWGDRCHVNFVMALF